MHVLNDTWIFCFLGWYDGGMDKGTLYRLALAKLGSSASLVEGTPEFAALEACSQQAVAFALDYAAWNFATKGPLVLPLSGGVAVLPGDCLELRDVQLERWRQVGRCIVAAEGESAASVSIFYKSREVADMLALPDHEPIFCEACVCLVAAAVAGRVTGNAQLGAHLREEGMVLLYRAKLKEARAVSSNDQLPRVYRMKGGQR